MQGYGMMDRKRIQRVFYGLLIAGGVLVLSGLTALAVDNMSSAPKAEGRADILVIDGLKSFGHLERPAVYFYHDKHTEALAKDNKDCSACHLKDKEGQSLKFKRLEDKDKNTAMAVYHDNCIACHKETSQAGKVSGPTTCGQCHVEDAAPVINRQSIALDKSLHYRHVKAMDKKCEQCHHAYNEQTKKLYYDKGQEGACLYCHKENTEENRISIRLASHEACIGCHQSIMSVRDKPRIKKLFEYWDAKKPIPWKKVNDIPDFVRFNHERHIQRFYFQLDRPYQEVCGYCHGDVKKLTVDRREKPLTMGWCRSCHMKDHPISKASDKIGHGPNDCFTCHK